MTCKRLLVPTKRGSCSHPQPLSHTALGGGLLPALPKPCCASSSSVPPSLPPKEKGERKISLPGTPLAQFCLPACRSYLDDLAGTTAGLPTASDLKAHPCYGEHRWSKHHGAREGGWGTRGWVAWSGVLTRPDHQWSLHVCPSVLLCWWPCGLFEARGEAVLIWRCIREGSLRQGCSSPPATLQGTLLHTGLFLAPKKETSHPKCL